MKKAIDFFTAHPARFFLLAALLWGGFMCFLNYKDGAEFSWHDLLVEANGMVFDLLVFGVLLSIYEKLREKRDKIERLHEEIDDYRGWDEKEAAFRIAGAVKRLSRLGVSEIKLFGYFLQKADLVGIRLWEANLAYANLQEANLRGACLWKASLAGANLIEANLAGADLRKASLIGANLRGAYLQGATLQGVDLGYVYTSSLDFQRACLEETNLEGAEVDKDWFKKLEEWQVIGREEIKAKYFIDENGVLREKQ